MKKITAILSAALLVSFVACNNQKDTKQKETERHNEKTEHLQKDSLINNKDSLGMRIGGNELDSKKK